MKLFCQNHQSDQKKKNEYIGSTCNKDIKPRDGVESPGALLQSISQAAAVKLSNMTAIFELCQFRMVDLPL